MSIKYKTSRGILVEDYDVCGENPRDMDDGIMSKFYTFSKNHLSPDEHKYSSFVEWLSNFLPPAKFKEVDAVFRKVWFSESSPESLLINYAFKRGFVLLPVYKYEHSGIIYQAAESNPFTCPFDSCMAGVIYVSKADIYKAYQKKCGKSMVSQVNEMLKAEVQQYSYYADGQVYVYTLLDDDGNEVDTMGGFYGPIETNGVCDAFDIEKDSIEMI